MTIHITSEPYFGQPKLEYYMPITQGTPIDPVMFMMESSHNNKLVEWYLSGNLPDGLTFSSRRAIGAEIMGTPTQDYYSREHAWVHVVDSLNNEEAVIPIAFEVRAQEHVDHSNVVMPPHVNVHVDDGPYVDHVDIHSDHANQIDYHEDHSDSRSTHVNTTGNDIHADSDHANHSDHTNVAPEHVDQRLQSHVDTSTPVTFPKHVDVAPPHIDSPPPINMKVRFDPGGKTPEPIDLVFKRGQAGEREKVYTVMNDGNGQMRVTLYNLPQGVTVTPAIMMVGAGESSKFTVKIDNNMFSNVGTGITQRNLDVKLELIGEPIG